MPPKVQAPIKQGANMSLKVIGNYFSPEMRTVCALLDLNQVSYTAEQVDIFSDSGRRDYAGLNPADQMPTIIDGLWTMLGDPPHLYKYLCKTKEIEEKFYPSKDMNKDKKKVIDQILEWIQTVFKRCSNRLTKLTLDKALLHKQLLEPEHSSYSDHEEAKEKDILFDVILENIEK